MDKALLTDINTIESSLSSLVNSLTTTNTFSAAPNAAQSILSADESLQQALKTLKQHQDNFQRILQLREEANNLHNQLQDVIKTCVRYRTEIGQIHPSILEDDDEDLLEDDSKGKEVSSQDKHTSKDVDYETLLSFAARIGKHNALAARAAEEESVNRQAEARRKREEARMKLANGQSQSQSSQSQTTLLPGTTAADGEAPAPSQTQTQESAANLAAIDEQLSAAHAYNGMAFPAPDVLRVGALGQLQLLREQGGEDAVMKEVERLVGVSELGVPGAEKSEEQEDRKPSIIPGLGMEQPVEPETETKKERQKPRQMSSSAGAAPKRKAVSLDFPDSDEEED